MSGALPNSAADAVEALTVDELFARLRRDPAGLVCVVVTDHSNARVLMVGWMDDEALRRTVTTGRVTYWSRSRQEYWRKGDTSGHAQYLRTLKIDCDGDALLLGVDQIGAACHNGTRSCFHAELRGIASVEPAPAAAAHANSEDR